MQCISGYLGRGQVVLACPGQYIFIKTGLRKFGVSEHCFPFPFQQFSLILLEHAVYLVWKGCTVVGSDILILFIHVMANSL